MFKRVFYVSGPGNIIESHRFWKEGRSNPTEVSLTFSGQTQDFCRDIGATAYFVSSHRDKALLTDGAFTFEHRPKAQRGGLAYHLGEVTYGIGLLRTALRFRADLALCEFGSHFFVLFLFRLFGICVIPILHNTLWPNGFPPRKPIDRLLLKLDSFFLWRRRLLAAIGVSPVCARQVEQLAGPGRRYPVLQIRAQFDPVHFAKIAPPPPHGNRPFRVIFVGRCSRTKGVFDILEMARALEDTHPGLVRWELCGAGPDFDELVVRHRELKLDGVVMLRGWTSPADQIAIYSQSHASIVPTRSSFSEGLAMTAAEAILAGRPLVTNPVVPALEVLLPACSPAKTDDVDSHRLAVLKLATDRDFYEQARAACAAVQNQFYDRSNGLAQVLKEAVRQRQ